MKILLLVPDIFTGTGGIQVFNNQLVKALNELGHALCVISMNDTENSGNAGHLFICHGRYGYLRKPLFIINTLKQVSNYNPDVVFCGHVNFSPLCMMVSTIFKIPYVTIAHGIEVWNLNGLKFSGLKHSNKILSVSRFTKDKILSQFPPNEKKDIFIFPNTLDSEKFKPAPKPQYLLDRWKIKEDDKVLLTIARLSKTEKYKGYDKVILAMKDIVKEIPNVKYVIGGDGDDRERIERLIKDNALEDKVILTGFISDKEIVDYYNLCDIFVMPSKGEGFGIVFLEALACGKAVIAGNKDGSADAVLNGEVGLLVDPDNIEEIKQAIINVLKKGDDKRLFDGDYLRKRVIEAYGFDKFKEKIEMLFNY